MSPAIASTGDFSWEEDWSEDLRLFDEEWEKSGGFNIDFSKLRHKFETGAVDLDDDDLVLDPDDTNVGLLNRLSNLAISYYNDKTDTRLELVKVLKANYHPSAGVTYYITFEASDCNQKTTQYQAVVRYLPRDTEVISCCPKPS
ncbi:unnamed protein product [Brassica rapa]|uniref:Cystatin domain-containing protein n=1 Tax=Brassica campestris TaxID=3711 RepID=A0A3P6B5I9_BRACM|nr:unnamed protein product [Brassica rapa]VDC97485.1 unnamed protein product [Brassica rapa]